MALSPEQYKDILHQQLCRLRDNGGPRYRSFGICAAVVEEDDVDSYTERRIIRLLHECFESFGLDPEFPVPNPFGGSADSIYYNVSDDAMWNPNHPYGAARWALVHRLIDHLENT